MATWQAYVDFIKGRGNVEHCLIISSEDGAQWASTSPDTFYLRQYKASIMQDDGNEKEETVNEATNLLKYMKGSNTPQGLRLNGQKKQQITRNFVDESTGLPVIITKIPNGGVCIAHAGKCIIIAAFNELQKHQSHECNETVVKMAAFLKASVWPEGFEGEISLGGGNAGPGNWQDHVDKALLGSKNIAEAMIVKLDNGDILASTPNFTVSSTMLSFAVLTSIDCSVVLAAKL